MPFATTALACCPLFKKKNPPMKQKLKTISTLIKGSAEAGGPEVALPPSSKICKICPFKNNESSNKLFSFSQSLGRRVTWII